MIPVLVAATVEVGPAVYRPPFRAEGDEPSVEVPAFRIDTTPVTNARYASFVASHPEWQRGRAPLALADRGYLASWASPSDPGPALDPDGPVVEVSWFAAEAYCEAHGGKVPTAAQWEVAAAGPEDPPDPGRTARILAWYARPNPDRLPPVGRSPANGWGARDFEGPVWEWVLDFNSDPNAGGRFCGGGSAGAIDPSDVATSVRYEMRASLRAAYTVPNLGFRCVYSAP